MRPAVASCDAMRVNASLPRRALLVATLGLLACSTDKSSPPTSRPSAPTTLLFVRHAEKAGDEPSAPLTEEGTKRAETLRDMLLGAGVAAIYSTDFVRTRQTAAPLAEALGLEVMTYDAEKAEAEAARILRQHPGGRVLVVGHRPNVPRMISALGGPELPRLERYDDMFVMTVFERGRTALTRLRYGPWSPPR